MSPTLSHLLALNGFDGFGGIKPSAWLRYTERITNQIRLHPPNSIFEVGCGAGAFCGVSPLVRLIFISFLFSVL